MNTWIALAAVGVATDNLMFAAVAGDLPRWVLRKKWLLALVLILVVQLPTLILGSFVGRLLVWQRRSLACGGIHSFDGSQNSY